MNLETPFNYKRKHLYKTSYTGRKLTPNEWDRLKGEERQDYLRFVLDLDKSEIGENEGYVISH